MLAGLDFASLLAALESWMDANGGTSTRLAITGSVYSALQDASATVSDEVAMA